MANQYAMALDLQDDSEAISTYLRHHESVWPEVLVALQAVGVLDMNIWRIGRRLFMLLETVDDFDLDLDFARYLTLHPRCAEWEALMGTLQVPLPEAAAGKKWVEMENIFHLQAQLHGPSTQA